MRGRGDAAPGRLIETHADVEEGAAWLAAQEPRFAQALSLTGQLPLRRSPDGFSQLLRAVVAQQISTAAAASIWARLEAAGLTERQAVLAASEEDLRALGLSRPKASYARALASAPVDWPGLRGLPDAQVVAELTRIRGIGRWTAEIYAIISLGRADVFAAGDLALQEAARRLFDWPDRPREAAFRAWAEQWSPWRAVAARLLWAYYRATIGREGIG